MKSYTEADLAEAWNSGYWHGTSHSGPLNDAAIREKNPHVDSDAGDPVKDHTDAAVKTTLVRRFPMNPNNSLAVDRSQPPQGYQWDAEVSVHLKEPVWVKAQMYTTDGLFGVARIWTPTAGKHVAIYNDETRVGFYDMTLIHSVELQAAAATMEEGGD